jgi:hypothetical protein
MARNDAYITIARCALVEIAAAPESPIRNLNTAISRSKAD